MTDYRIHSFSSEDVDAKLFADLTRFCEETEFDHKLPNENWQLTNWENRSETFLHCLLKTSRFSRANGEVTVVYDADRIVAISGVYLADFAPQLVAIGGVRAHTLIQERNKSSQRGKGFLHGDMIFPRQLEWAKKRDLQIFALTFNMHNRWLAEFILRIGRKKAIGLGFKPAATAQQFYSDFRQWPNPVIIKNTTQYLLYKNLQNNAYYDFSTLENLEPPHASIS